MMKLAMILGLCAFISAPAFAEGETAAKEEAPAAAAPAAPAKGHGKAAKGHAKGMKGKHGKKKEAAAPAEGEHHE